MKIRAAMVALIAAAVVGAAWPWFSARSALATAVPPAPVATDYRQRDRNRRVLRVASAPRPVRSNHCPHARESVPTTVSRKLATSATLREPNSRRARSLRFQPQGNVQALASLASSDLSFHHFNRSAADSSETRCGRARSNDDARAQTASLLMELGRYRAPPAVLRKPTEASQSHLDVDPGAV